jgi:hypothetical protein
VTFSSPSLSSPETPSSPTGSNAGSAELLRHQKDGRVRCYLSQFADVMEMRAPAGQVAAYLDRHEGWFRRCASPMTVEPLASNGYRLTLGRFGNFGFEVEPTIALELLPQSEGIYRIVTVPTVGESSGLEGLYDVDFNASLTLDEAAESEVTLVRWQLDLSVWIRLPGVITLLPDQLVQTSGDHLLRQIVRQISRKLTWKVQEDFHASHSLDCPPRRRAQF